MSRANIAEKGGHEAYDGPQAGVHPALDKLAPSRKVVFPILLAAVAFGACDDPDVFLSKDQFGQPAGALAGTLTYSGPSPCTEGGHVVGAGIIFAFDDRLLPPPDGFGTSASSFAVVAGETLFASLRPTLTFDPKGGRWCPDNSAAPVTVSAPWAMAPLAAGQYQIRGFYDHDGNFDPSFSITNLPTAGDVAGGAIDNISEVLATPPKPARYRELPLGNQPQPGGAWQMPPTGAKIGEIAVTFALTIPTQRPIFHAAAVDDAAPVQTANPLQVHMPADFQLNRVVPQDPKTLDDVQASFVRMHLAAGVPANEVAAASGNPFFLPVTGTPIVFTHEDVDGNGTIDASDHVFDSPLPSLYPKGFFTRLPDGSNPPKKSVAVLQGLTIDKSFNDTAGAPLVDAQAEAIIALRPAVLCLDPLDPSKPGAMVITHNTDKNGNPVVADENGLRAALSAKFKRQIDLVYGCLPTGQYAVSLVYPTGQAWTTPNEAGICAPSETPGNGTCGKRPQLISQTGILLIDAPSDASYCQGHPTPAACTD